MPRLILCFLFLASAAASGAVVKTLDGQTRDGEIRFAPGELLLSHHGKSDPIPLDSILSINFRAASPAPRAAVPHWQGYDVGAPHVQGSVSMSRDSLTVRAGGQDVGGSADQFFFISQLLTGDCQLVAKVSKVLNTDRRAFAGLMIRSGIDASAPYALVKIHPDGSAAFSYRLKGRAPAGVMGGEFQGPWIKLVRQGNSVSGYCSTDGHDWDLIDTQTLAIPAAARIGFAVCAKNPQAVCNAVIEKFSLTQGDVAPLAPAARGVLLRDGSMIAGHPRSASPSTVKITRNRDPELSIPLTSVARIILTPAPKDLLSQVPSGRTGALLSRGDFFEGDITSFEGDDVRVNSVLFGQRRFALHEVLVLILHDAAASSSQFEIRASDGTTISADKLSVEKDRLLVSTPAGPVRFSPSELIQISAGSARFKSLADLKPAEIRSSASNDSSNFAIDSALAPVPMSLSGQVAQRSIALGAGTSVSYDLAAQYRILTFRFGVPDGILPASSPRLIVLGDGKELYKSPPRTSIDPPAAATINLANVHRLTLRLESTSPAGASALIADPALAK